VVTGLGYFVQLWPGPTGYGRNPADRAKPFDIPSEGAAHRPDRTRLSRALLLGFCAVWALRGGRTAVGGERRRLRLMASNPRWARLPSRSLLLSARAVRFRLQDALSTNASSLPRGAFVLVPPLRSHAVLTRRRSPASLQINRSARSVAHDARPHQSTNGGAIGPILAEGDPPLMIGVDHQAATDGRSVHDEVAQRPLTAHSCRCHVFRRRVPSLATQTKRGRIRNMTKTVRWGRPSSKCSHGGSRPLGEAAVDVAKRFCMIQGPSRAWLVGLGLAAGITWAAGGSASADEQASLVPTCSSPKSSSSPLIILDNQTYALCATASCFVFNDVAYCKCDVRFGRRSPATSIGSRVSSRCSEWPMPRRTSRTTRGSSMGAPIFSSRCSVRPDGVRARQSA
jgi:hypothetical protein